MPIYSKKNDVLTPITEKKLDLERDVQKLTEGNLETVFGLKFISGATNQEFAVKVQEQDFFIDTLAFDENQKSFVIIEYKKDRSFSVIDQGFAYLSAMLNHKGDFILELNERLGVNYKKNDINWEQSRVIFISPEFTNYQKNAINFQNLPIYLYEVKTYENDTIEYSAVKPYRTSESIDKLTKDKTIQKVSNEVKVYTEEDFLKKDEALKELYLAFKEQILQIDSSLILNPTKSYIGIQIPGSWRLIMSINFRKDRISLHFGWKKDYIDPKKKIKVLKTGTRYITIRSQEDVIYAVNIFKQEYDEFMKRFG